MAHLRVSIQENISYLLGVCHVSNSSAYSECYQDISAEAVFGAFLTDSTNGSSSAFVGWKYQYVDAFNATWCGTNGGSCVYRSNSTMNSFRGSFGLSLSFTGVMKRTHSYAVELLVGGESYIEFTTEFATLTGHPHGSASVDLAGHGNGVVLTSIVVK